MARSVEALRAALRRALADVDPCDAAHDIAHADRVWLNARIIARGEGMERCDQLMAACYLHDLVTLPKNDPARHRASRLSAKSARPLLTRLGFNAKETDEICHAIEAHSFSADIPCDTLLAKVVQDADRIESLGAIGLARCFAVSGALGRPLFHGTDPFGDTRDLDDTEYAVDHFRLKLLSLPDQMQTETGRTLAHERAEVLRRFLQNLAGELGNPVPNW